MHTTLRIRPTEITLGRLIGKGSEASVFIGHYRSRRVAVKRSSPSAGYFAYLGTDSYISLVCNSITILSRLQDCSTPQLIGVCERPGHVIDVVMEYIPGRSLSACLRELGYLTSDQVVYTLIGIVQAVAQIHEAGIVHRDLKTDNIIVGHSYQIWVCDFGLASILGDCHPMHCKLSAAPEIQTPRRAATTKADVYSIGLMAVELMTGQNPQSSDGAINLPGVITVCHEISPALCSIIMPCLHPDPIARPTLPELESTLQRLIIHTDEIQISQLIDLAHPDHLDPLHPTSEANYYHYHYHSDI